MSPYLISCPGDTTMARPALVTPVYGGYLVEMPSVTPVQHGSGVPRSTYGNSISFPEGAVEPFADLE